MWTPGVIPSTVATMSFALYCMGIPCPAVFAWNDDPGNPVHYPYTLMEKADGELLGELFYPASSDNVMNISEKVDALGALSKLYVSMTRPIGEYFQPYGSIFFDETCLEYALDDARSYTIGSLTYSKPVDKNAANMPVGQPIKRYS